MSSPISEKPDRLSPPPHDSSMTARRRSLGSEGSIHRTLPRYNPVKAEKQDEIPPPASRPQARSLVERDSVPSPETNANTITSPNRIPNKRRTDGKTEEASQDPLNQRTNSDPSSSTSRTSPPRQDSDNWTESDALVPRRNLTELDVAALILNKMVCFWCSVTA